MVGDAAPVAGEVIAASSAVRPVQSPSGSSRFIQADGFGEASGAVGIGEFDIERASERQRSTMRGS